jgi:uncharacterized protein (TIGR03084 family)
MTLPKTSVLDQVVSDLREETAAIVSVLAGLKTSSWEAPTPAAGWTIRDQVTHLAFFDDATLLAICEPDAFLLQRDDLLRLGDAFPDAVADRYRTLPADECLAWFGSSRQRLLRTYLDHDPSYRLPWYGPDMGMAASATGRLMETWAHGQDVVDTVGLVRPSTSRLRSVADLGVRTLGFAFRLNGRPVPPVPVHVRLDGPDGVQWTWGPENAADRVSGSALDFCLLVTQRRRLLDTALEVAGSVAAEWMEIAQAYAGGVGARRAAGPFAAGAR